MSTRMIEVKPAPTTSGPLTLDLTPGVRLSVTEAREKVPMGVPLSTRLKGDGISSFLLVKVLPVGTIVDYSMVDRDVKRCEVRKEARSLIQTDKQDWWNGNQYNATITVISWPIDRSLVNPLPTSLPLSPATSRLTLEDAARLLPEGTAWQTRLPNGELLARVLPVGTVVLYSMEPASPKVVDPIALYPGSYIGDDSSGSIYILNYPKNPPTFRCYASNNLREFIVAGPCDPAVDRTQYPIELPLEYINDNHAIGSQRSAAVTRYISDRLRYIEETYDTRLDADHFMDIRKRTKAAELQAEAARQAEAQAKRDREEQERIERKRIAREAQAQAEAAVFDSKAVLGTCVQIGASAYIVARTDNAISLIHLNSGNRWSDDRTPESRPTYRDLIGRYGMTRGPKILTRTEAAAFFRQPY